MSYSFYKIMHIVFLLIFVSSLSMCFAVEIQNKKARILSMVSSFLLLTAGFGLLARLGLIKGWPLWVWAKLAIWLVVSVAGPIAARKAKKHRMLIWSVLLSLMFIAAALAILKPV